MKTLLLLPRLWLCLRFGRADHGNVTVTVGPCKSPCSLWSSYFLLSTIGGILGWYLQEAQEHICELVPEGQIEESEGCDPA